jgi:hypothetical protein
VRLESFVAPDLLKGRLKKDRPIRSAAGYADQETVRGESRKLVSQYDRNRVDAQTALVQAVQEEMAARVCLLQLGDRIRLKDRPTQPILGTELSQIEPKDSIAGCTNLILQTYTLGFQGGGLADSRFAKQGERWNRSNLGECAQARVLDLAPISLRIAQVPVVTQP